MFRSPLVVLLFVFAVCSFCGKEFVSLGRHSWRCKSKLHPESEFPYSRNISSPLLPPESMKVVTNGSKIVNCSCGKQCKGLKGLKAHQHSCRTIQGLHGNLLEELDNDFNENEAECAEDIEFPTPSNICSDVNAKADLKLGIKLPKSHIQWSIANDYFKADFLNSPISAQNANSAIKELNYVIYNYFCTTYGPVNSNNISSFVLKYRDMNAKELKRNLRILKQSGAGLEEITFVSRKLRQILKSGNNDDNRISSDIDHDSYIKDNFWGYVKRIVKSKANTLPSFTETECISYFKCTFSALSSNKIFKIPTWIPQFAPPQMPFKSDPPSYQQVSNVIRKMKSSGSPCPLDQISILCFKRCPYLRSHLAEIIHAVWLSGEVPCHWKKACTILVHKAGASNDPANFRPITLESVPLKVCTSCLRNFIYHFLVQNIYIECNIQKGFTPKISGTIEHTSQMANIINSACLKQRSLVITLLDLQNAFGTVIIILFLRY